MLAISKRNQRALALITVASLLTISPSASQSPQPAAAAPPAPAPVAAPVAKSAYPVTSAPSTMQSNADANMQRQQASGTTGERIQWPMVDVNREPNKSTVDVHVPIFFDMVNHKDDQAGKSKLDLSVLQGLVTVNRDKERDQNGQLTGPLKVTVFGIPVYTSKGLAGPQLQPRSAGPPPLPIGSAQPLVAAAAQRDLDNTLAQVNQTLTRKAEDIVAQVTENTRRTNDKMLKSLSDIFERFSSMMRATSNRVSSTASSIWGPQQQPQQSQSIAQDKKLPEKSGENQLSGNKLPGAPVSYDFRA